jgi:glutathione reductase (NADPH)
MQEFDTIIIGAGTAGQTAAYDLVAEGLRVAVVERSQTPGGICALHGCQAKKWFYEVTETVARSRHLHHLGITVPAEADWAEILQEKNRFTAKIPEATIKNLQGNGISYFSGEASFIDHATLSVNGEQFTADTIIIASGAEPMRLPISGAEQLATSNDFLALTELPKRIAFIGGGFISFEFAHFAARLGASPGEIHILEAQDRPLAPFDGEMVNLLVEASTAEGIRLHTGVSVTAIGKTASGYRVELQSGDSLEVDLVVNGTGRTASIAALNLEAAGVDFTRRGISVDGRMQTTNQRIYAIGDCAASLQLARVADMEGHIAAQAIIAGKESGQTAEIDYRAAPAVLFTYPQLAMVGRTEEQLQEAGVKYWKSHDSHLSWPTYRRIGMKHAAYKILVDGDNRILGGHFLADNTTGLVNTFKQAMLDGTTIAELSRSNIMAPYPSRESDILYMLGPLLD